MIFKKSAINIMSKKAGGPGSPAFIEYKGTRFLIINQPSVSTMSNFIDVSYCSYNISTHISSTNFEVVLRSCGIVIVNPLWVKMTL